MGGDEEPLFGAEFPREQEIGSEAEGAPRHGDGHDDGADGRQILGAAEGVEEGHGHDGQRQEVEDLEEGRLEISAPREAEGFERDHRHEEGRQQVHGLLRRRHDVLVPAGLSPRSVEQVERPEEEERERHARHAGEVLQGGVEGHVRERERWLPEGGDVGRGLEEERGRQEMTGADVHRVARERVREQASHDERGDDVQDARLRADGVRDRGRDHEEPGDDAQRGLQVVVVERVDVLGGGVAIAELAEPLADAPLHRLELELRRRLGPLRAGAVVAHVLTSTSSIGWPGRAGAR
ncbi:MAG: hypothetical protein U0183_09205 [Polyangiaceae bacterium]